MQLKGAALADSWRKTLAGISTNLGRLEYLASLRNAHSGQYEHTGLAQRIGADETDLLLRHSHAEVFQQRLELEQPSQKVDAERYLEGLEGDKREIISNWLVLRPYTNWVPSDSRDVERRLFLEDLYDVVDCIRTEYRVASPDPD